MPDTIVQKRELKLVDVTGKTAAEIEDFYNVNAGPLGWRIIQIIQIGSNWYIAADREI